MTQLLTGEVYCLNACVQQAYKQGLALGVGRSWCFCDGQHKNQVKVVSGTYIQGLLFSEKVTR